MGYFPFQPTNLIDSSYFRDPVYGNFLYYKSQYPENFTFHYHKIMEHYRFMLQQPQDFSIKREKPHNNNPGWASPGAGSAEVFIFFSFRS